MYIYIFNGNHPLIITSKYQMPTEPGTFKILPRFISFFIVLTKHLAYEIIGTYIPTPITGFHLALSIGF